MNVYQNRGKLNGVLIIDKPAGMTSHDVVNRVRRITNERSAGHLGTLDPMATGVLPLVLGRFTRLAQFYTGADKSYEGEIRFGFATNTYDAEGEVVGPIRNDIKVTLEEVRRTAEHFRGMISQTPPQFSAKKVDGVAAYKLARKKQEVELKPVQIEIKHFEILKVEDQNAFFSVQVSSGAYIRSIAHEMGQRLGCGAHLASLRRTASGEFSLSDAHTLEELQTAVENREVESVWVHPRRILQDMPCVTTTDETAAMVRNGRAVNLPEMSKARLVKVFLGQNELIAIASRIAGTLFQPKVVFAAE